VLNVDAFILDITGAAHVSDTKPIIFVVEDDPAVRNSLKFALELEGYRVRLCASGQALLRDADLPQSQCLVVDLRLPGMDGLELLTELRRRNIKIPAVLVTSHPSQEVVTRAARGGIPIVEKPFLGNTLSDSIRRAIDAASPPAQA